MVVSDKNGRRPKETLISTELKVCGQALTLPHGGGGGRAYIVLTAHSSLTVTGV